MIFRRRVNWLKPAFFLFLFLAVNASATAQKPRVIALAPHITEIIFELGAGDSIVGAMARSDYPKEALKIPRVGNHAALQIETIVRLNPDYIFAWKSGNPEQDLDRLRSIGFKVIYSAPSTLDILADEIEMFADYLGEQQQGKLIAGDYRQRLAKLRQQYQNKTKLSAFYELWSRPLTTVAGNAWPQQQLSICGVTNPFADLKSDYPNVSLEQVITLDPQLIIQPTLDKQPSSDRINWEKWRDLKAVKADALITANSDLLHRMTSRMLDGLEQLCQDIDVIRQQQIAGGRR